MVVYYLVVSAVFRQTGRWALCTTLYTMQPPRLLHKDVGQAQSDNFPKLLSWTSLTVNFSLSPGGGGVWRKEIYRTFWSWWVSMLLLLEPGNPRDAHSPLCSTPIAGCNPCRTNTLLLPHNDCKAPGCAVLDLPHTPKLLHDRPWWTPTAHNPHIHLD